MADRKDGVSASPEFHRFLFEANPQSMWVFDPVTLAILDANEAAVAHYGYAREALLRMRMTDLLAPGEEESVREALARTMRDAPPGQMTAIGLQRHRRRDGRPADVEMSWGVVRAEDAVTILALAHDVTERNFAEQALWASEAQIRGILETALDAIVLMDARGLVLSWNPRAESVFGWSRQEAVGRRMAELIVPPRYREAHLRGLRRYLETGDGPILNRPVELSALRRDGTEFPAELRVTALREIDRVVFCAFIEDISERKRTEEAVLASEKRYRALFESNPLPILLYEPDTLRILAVNPAAVRHYGYSEWEFRDRSLPDLWAHEEPGAARGDAPAGRGARHRTKGGRVFDTEVTAQAIEYAGRPARIAVVQDVTERHQEEERLRQAEERFEKAFRASPAAMSITTLKEARFLDVNEAFTRLTGWRREEVVGRTSFELGTWIDAGERAEFIARLSRDGAVRRMPIRLQGADGVERLIVISGQVIELAGERCVLAQTEEVVR